MKFLSVQKSVYAGNIKVIIGLEMRAVLVSIKVEVVYKVHSGNGLREKREILEVMVLFKLFNVIVAINGVTNHLCVLH